MAWHGHLAWVRVVYTAAAGLDPCTSRYMIGPTGTLSGKGKLWEYYHFLIDFAPRVLSELRNDTCARAEIHVPGWYHDHRFLFSLPGTERSVQQLADDVFSPRKLTMVEYGLHDAPAHRELPFHTRPFSGADQPLFWDMHFHDHMWRRANVTLERVARSGPQILLIRRGYPKSPTFRGTGAMRRRLPDEWWQVVLAFLQSNNLPHKVVELEGKSLVEQVRLFAHATVIIGIHGAGLSNIVFAAPGASIIELATRACWCFVRLARRASVNYYYVPDKTASPAFFRTLSKALARSGKFTGERMSAAVGH